MRYVIAFLLCAVLAHATTVVPPDFDELVEGSELVFRGRVTSVVPAWTGEGADRRIVTRVTFAVERSLRGAAAETLTLEFLGGQIGPKRLDVVGAPKLSAGDRGVFFVENRRSRICPLLRLRHGCYRILPAPDGGEDRVARDDRSPLRSVQAVREPLAEGSSTPAALAGTTGGMTLVEFERAVLERSTATNKEVK